MFYSGIHQRVYMELNLPILSNISSQIGPPKVSLATSEKSISIVLSAPEKWKRNPEDPTVSMQQIYSNLKYNISVYNTKSKRTWSQFVTNHTLVLSLLEPSTLYCITVESFVPGPRRPAQPSQQCVSTLKDQTSALKVKIIFWYVLPVSVVLFLFSVIGYSIYRYIHVGKEKHPANLILIYGSEFDKRFFTPAEKIVVNIITFNILDDSQISQKDTVENINDRPNLPAPAPVPSWSGEPHAEEAWVKHLGYTSPLMGILCDVEERGQGVSLTQEAWLGAATPTEEAATDYEYDIRADISLGPAEDQPNVQEEGPRPGTLPVQQTTLAQALLYSYAPGLCDLEQERTVPDQGRAEPPMTLVDWDPRTGRLCIPSLSSFDPEPEDCGHWEADSLPEQSLLSRLYEQQASNTPAEEREEYLQEFTEEWGLYVQMES
ncbi:interleukin-20 receptor subunit alpha isoform X2 [Perognathus longimembris pacificus]|uniref:interleukin-20 receptor subunit alpha isoform X2 n=1 Tax=Perognathus longimembris pacificus TaxID=214514 RepID=UPI002018C67F|nr:interleukin-20 receptor subunit alpha isoform X2 [Perognathus longimembris pacificus]